MMDWLIFIHFVSSTILNVRRFNSTYICHNVLSASAISRFMENMVLPVFRNYSDLALSFAQLGLK